MKVALIGTRGVPARYGGFETAVEEIGAGLSELGHEVTVYCRTPSEVGPVYRGVRRVELPAVKGKASETLTHSFLSTLHALRDRPDVAIVFNAANAPFLGLLRGARIMTALHIDGHDGRRRKWKGAGRRYYSVATRLGLRLAHDVIVDSRAVQQEIAEGYRTTSTFIAYGAKTTVRDDEHAAKLLDPFDLELHGYHLLVARFEPENQVLECIRGFVASEARLPLVVVGFAGFPSDYNAAIEAIGDPRVRRVGAVWDQELLDALYAGCATYLHGHSVGGTNPSLLRAMVNGSPVVAYDCAYNRESTGGHAQWFSDAERDVGPLLAATEDDRTTAVTQATAARVLVHEEYTWSGVVTRYDELLTRLAPAAALRSRDEQARGTRP